MTAAFILDELHSVAYPKKAQFLQRFFKTGKGEYAEGDIFLGIVVPIVRNIAKANRVTPLSELEILIKSKYHEARLTALLIMIEQFKRADDAEQSLLYTFYLNHTAYINNWDLVDVTCSHILGEYLLTRDRAILYTLAESALLWDQRIAIISTITFIRNHEYFDTFALAEKLMTHKHDLIHKAIGWMLREVGKRDKDALCDFLDRYTLKLPRTSLRYAIERFTPEERSYYMKLK